MLITTVLMCTQQRPKNLEKADRALAACRERGIEFELSLIFGLPQQTVQPLKLCMIASKVSGHLVRDAAASILSYFRCANTLAADLFTSMQVITTLLLRV